jgi:hypothetical protein
MDYQLFVNVRKALVLYGTQKMSGRVTIHPTYIKKLGWKVGDEIVEVIEGKETFRLEKLGYWKPTTPDDFVSDIFDNDPNDPIPEKERVITPAQ